MSSKTSQYSYVDTDRALLIMALYSRHGERCFYCDDVDFKEEAVTIDHYIPVSYCLKNGWSSVDIHNIDNLRPSCRKCNAKKGDLVPNADGSIPKRKPNRVERRKIKKSRPDVCDTCSSGRLLFAGEVCEDCGSGPQPEAYPTAYKKEPKNCSHGWDDPRDHCWYCMLGFVKRRPAIESVLDVDAGD